MPDVRFDKVVEEVKALSPAEQRQLRALLDMFLAPPPTPMTEDEFAHRLVEFGVISDVKPPITDLTSYQNRQPVETTGKPLSEIILEERRQVAAYFFDSSALVKRYVQETGTAWVLSITDPAADHVIYIARITGVEVVSALTRQTRSGALSPTATATPWRDSVTTSSASIKRLILLPRSSTKR